MPPHDVVTRLVAVWDGSPLELDGAAHPSELLGDLAHHVAARAGAADGPERVAPVFDEVERLLGDGNPSMIQLVTFGFLEDVQNIASHVDTAATASSLEPIFGERTLDAWQSVDALWRRAADASSATGRPPAIDLQRYLTVTSPELRRFIQRSYRLMDGVRMVGLPDVLRFEASNGGGPHRFKA